MNDIWINRLSEYLDGELDNEERAALEAHLATCGQCYATLGELSQVVTRAKALQNTEPATDLWPDIRARLMPARDTRIAPAPARSRRFAFTIPQLLAACLALVMLSGGVVWMALGGGARRAPFVNSADEPTPPPEFRTVSNERWKVQSDMAIADLQDALTLNEGKLDTATVRIVRQNLAVIDRAISQAQRALKRDPGNTYLNLHLANTMRQKIDLLRRANALAGES